MRRLAITTTILAILLSPIYIWKSGLPQVSHILALAAMMLYIISTRGKILWSNKWVWGLLFAMYSSIVNAIIGIRYKDMHTALAILYYYYDWSIYVLVINVAARVGMKKFMRIVSYILFGTLIMEVVLQLAGLGRLFGTSRAMATFNDPNQFAHWVLWVVLIVAISGWAVWHSWIPGWTALGVGAIALILSVSRSGLIGLVWAALVLGMATLMVPLSRMMHGRFVNSRSRTIKWILTLVALSTPVVIYMSMHRSGGIREVGTVLEEKTVFYSKRITNGINKGQTNMIERGYDRLWKFPEYLVLGAGEGANQRWAKKTWFLGEIHSTPAGLIFYYGIPGLIFFGAFYLYIIIIQPMLFQKLLLIAPIIYGLGTYNLRNWFFWMGLAIFTIAAMAKQGDDEGGIRESK